MCEDVELQEKCHATTHACVALNSFLCWLHLWIISNVANIICNDNHVYGNIMALILGAKHVGRFFALDHSIAVFVAHNAFQSERIILCKHGETA